jgi:hypothetical protein
MPPAPYRRLARRVPNSRWARLARSGSRLIPVCGSLAGALWACEPEYSLAPTFCDDWCHATLRRDCADGPSSCVRDCELTKASGACRSKQEALLGCYEGAEDEAFVCVQSGEFGEDQRVDPEVCRAERDSLYECLAPGFGVCLDLCRTEQARQLERVPVSSIGRLDFSVLSEDAGARAGCPVLDQPCEDVCWTVFAFTSGGLEAQGVTPAASDADQGVGASCLEAVGLGCFLPAEPSAGSDAGEAGEKPSMRPALDDCASLFGGD